MGVNAVSQDQVNESAETFAESFSQITFSQMMQQVKDSLDSLQEDDSSEG